MGPTQNNTPNLNPNLGSGHERPLRAINPEGLAPQEDFDKFVTGDDLPPIDASYINDDRGKALGDKARSGMVDAAKKGSIAIASFVNEKSPFHSVPNDIEIARRKRESNKGV